MSTVTKKTCDRCDKEIPVGTPLRILEHRLWAANSHASLAFDICSSCMQLFLQKFEELRVEFGPKGK